MLHHVREIFKGEYDVPYSRRAPVVIDIGANVGAFALWASQRWPGSIIHCYEPVPTNFEMLQQNLSCLDHHRVHMNNFAIGDTTRTQMLLGKNNCGEASFFDIGEQTAQTIRVETKDAAVLPQAHVLKVDTEGSEIEILERHRSIEYEVILIEFHGDNNRRQIDIILGEYCLIGSKVRHPHRGILKYVHRRMVPPEFRRFEIA